MNYRSGYPSSSSSFAYRWHQILMLFGFRPSIPSILRRVLLGYGPPPPLSHIASTLSKTPSSPCYLMFCTPTDVLLLEKDLKTATTITSPSFLVVTNHDSDSEGVPPSEVRREIQKDSVERKTCVERLRARLAVPPTVDDVRSWLRVRPITNECTHFSCIMDPSVEGGGILWSHMFEKPIRM